jgi:hypothetical protein
MLYRQPSIINNMCKKIIYYTIFLTFIVVYSMLEVLNLYLQYRTFIYLNNPKLRKTYLWLINLIIIHNMLKFVFACSKLRDYYNICQKKKIN